MADVKYYGKYRAKVVDVNDPERRGRIRVQCPSVLGTHKSAWCEPCIPYATDFAGDYYVFIPTDKLLALRKAIFERSL